MGRREWREIEERLSGARLEAAHSRREFLERTACIAGLAGLASLPASTLVAQAAKAQALPLPDPRNIPVDHVVILMMENRSFDHYFGWLPGADASQHEAYADPGGNRVETRHAATLGDARWQGCGHPDPGHGWGEGRTQLRDGFLAEGSGNDVFALTYYNEDELGFIHAAGREFTVYDRFFCSLLGPTWPNRYYKWSAQSGGRKDNSPPVATAGNQWETLFDRALRNNPANTPDGVTARYYNSDLPFSAVWGPRGVPWTRPIAEFYADCAAGTLPNIAIVDPPFRDGGGFDGNSADEHPLGDVRLGQAFMADVAHAFMASPNYRRGAMFIIYDEWGGFFDHVTPPRVPDARASGNLDEDFGQLGFRIPAIALSPYARRGHIAHDQLAHESILKFCTDRFGLGDLTVRDANATNIGVSFDFDNPSFDVPDLPRPVHVASRPCAAGGGDLADESARAHVSDLDALEDLADRFGFKVGEGKPHEIFREPDSVRKVLQAAG